MTGGTTRAALALVHGELTREIIGAFFVGLAPNFGPRPTFGRLLLTSPQEGPVVIRL
jgi:hypothetical protein